MENLFLESPGIRRKFLDRMTYNFFSNHAEYLLKYEHFAQSRTKILCDIDWDNKWLEQIEMNIAELSLKIIDNRIECIKIINSFLESTKSNNNLLKLLDNIKELLSKGYKINKLDEFINKANF